MKKTILICLLMLPVISPAQANVFEKLFGHTSRDKAPNVPTRACNCQHLNTAVLFPKPPQIDTLIGTPQTKSTVAIRACIKNLKSADGLRLTLNGEEQPINLQTLSTGNDSFCPTGYFFSYTLPLPAARNVISLEARNEGGATIRYLEFPPPNKPATIKPWDNH